MLTTRSLEKMSRNKSSERFRFSTIRTRLLVGFVLMALLPAIAIAAGSIVVGYNNGRQQALDRLESAAALKESEIKAWMHSLQNELAVALNEEYALDRAQVVLNLSQRHQYVDYFNAAMRKRFQRQMDQTRLLDEIFLLDLEGRVALSTDVAQEGQYFSSRARLQAEQAAPYMQLLLNAPSPGQSWVLAAIPVAGTDGQPLGVMAGRAGMETLDGILHERTGLGGTGRAYLVDANYTLLSAAGSKDSQFATREARSWGIDAAIETQANSSGVYTDYRGGRVVGVYRWLPELQVALLAEQDLSEAFGAIVTALGVNLSIALAAVLLAMAASLFITRGISEPLVDLARTASQIAAGDLAPVAQVGREDEIGVLAQAFNTMTARLRELISNLEQRVAERTQALQRRALQLETSARVSREITSILAIDDLLAQVVRLIREAFGYYNVLVFLVDEEAEQLVLRASSGDINPRSRRLEIGGNSRNSQAVQTGQSLLVNDVTQDPRFRADELLPDTRSELVIPLRAGERVIGALDLHAADVDAFTPEDVLVSQSLGDQIAVAIENARLYQQARQVATMEERRRLARELHDSVTQSLYSLTLLTEGGRRLARAGKLESAEEYLADLWEIALQSLKEMRLLVYELRPLALEQEGLVGALQQRLDAVEGRAGVEARLLLDGEIELAPPLEEALYGIAQEALNNALKHAAATTLTVWLRAAGGHIELEIADNGCGFDPRRAADSGGLGLTTMRQRAEQLGSELLIHSAPGEGTRVKVSVEVSA